MLFLCSEKRDILEPANHAGEEKRKQCHLSVEGMTCSSCVAHIEKVIGAVEGEGVLEVEFRLAGVHSITVALMFLSADVVYDGSIITAAEIAEKIDDLGYPCSVAEDTSSSLTKQNFAVRFSASTMFSGGRHDQRRCCASRRVPSDGPERSGELHRVSPHWNCVR